MTLDPTDDEKAALVAHLRHALEYDPFPFALRLDSLKSVLATLEPPRRRQPGRSAGSRKPCVRGALLSGDLIS